MSMEQVIEKLDQIEAEQSAKLDEKVEAIKVETKEAVEAAVAGVKEELEAVQAKLAQAPSVLKIVGERSVRVDANRNVISQLKEFSKNGKTELELKLFESEDQYAAFMKEASALTGGGDGKGGMTMYDPVFTALRLENPLRGIARTVATAGSSYQFRTKIGNAGIGWGYPINNNGANTTEDTAIWQQVLQDMNVQFPVRTAVLDDVDALESNIIADMLAEASEVEGLAMVQNNDQAAGAYVLGGTNGPRGLNQYGGANATYTGGSTSQSSFGTSGSGATSGLHNVATYDQLTTNAAAGVQNIKYEDVVNFVYALPQQYWTSNAKIMCSPSWLAAVRGLTDQNGTPVFERMAPLEAQGIVGRVLGFDVVVNKYMDTGLSSSSTAATTSLYPAIFADWDKFYTIVDRLSMVLRRYDQTQPGYITFYSEKRLTTSVRDPFAGVRYRSTATAAARPAPVINPGV